MKGEQAHGYSAAEHEALIGRCFAEAVARSAGDPACFPLGYIIVSEDNDSAHRRFGRNTPPHMLNEIPACSPDIHKVVEHPLGPFNRAWYREFTLDKKCTTCNGAMVLAAEILRRTTPESIKKDIESLPATFRSIIANKGGWADAELC